MSAGSAKTNEVMGVIRVIGVIDVELSGLQMGNPDNPDIITPETPHRTSSSNPYIIAHL